MTTSCKRALTVDVAAYLADPASPTWRDFTRHLRACDECRAEIEAWRSLRPEHAADDADHPAEDDLLAYADARTTLSAATVAGIANHLARCASCRDEVTVLENVRIDAAEAAMRAPAEDRDPAAATAAVRARERGGSRLARDARTSDLGESRVGRWLAGLGEVLRRPVFAYALVVLLLVPTVVWMIDTRTVVVHPRTSYTARESATVFEQSAPAQPPSQDSDADREGASAVGMGAPRARLDLVEQNASVPAAPAGTPQSAASARAMHESAYARAVAPDRKPERAAAAARSPKTSAGAIPESPRAKAPASQAVQDKSAADAAAVAVRDEHARAIEESVAEPAPTKKAQPSIEESFAANAGAKQALTHEGVLGTLRGLRLGAVQAGSSGALSYMAGGRVAVRGSDLRDGKLVVRIVFERRLRDQHAAARAVGEQEDLANEPADVVGEQAGRADDPAAPADAQEGLRNSVAVPANASEIEIRVQTADGRTSLRETAVRIDASTASRFVVTKTIAAAALSIGENRLALYAPGESEPIAPALVVEWHE